MLYWGKLELFFSMLTVAMVAGVDRRLNYSPAVVLLASWQCVSESTLPHRVGTRSVSEESVGKSWTPYLQSA